MLGNCSVQGIDKLLPVFQKAADIFWSEPLGPLPGDIYTSTYGMKKQFQAQSAGCRREGTRAWQNRFPDCLSSWPCVHYLSLDNYFRTFITKASFRI